MPSFIKSQEETLISTLPFPRSLIYLSLHVFMTLRFKENFDDCLGDDRLPPRSSALQQQQFCFCYSCCFKVFIADTKINYNPPKVVFASLFMDFLFPVPFLSLSLARSAVQSLHRMFKLLIIIRHNSRDYYLKNKYTIHSSSILFPF